MRELSKSTSARKIAVVFGVGKTQIQNILKRKAEVLEDVQNNASGEKKRARYTTGNEDINDLVLTWFKDATTRRMPVSGPLMCAQAPRFASDLGIETFKASTGWLASFLSRHNIVLGTMSGERGDVNKDTVNDWKEKLPAVCEGYEPMNIFNMDETGLFFRDTTRKSYHFKDCDGVLTDPFGVITSPNYPQDYSSNAHCTWFINAPEGFLINVNFTDFALEDHFKCEYDDLTLYHGTDTSSPSIGRFCGTATPRGFKSQSNSVRIVFSTDSSGIARGFNMTYTFSVQGIIYMGCYQDSGNQILAGYDYFSDTNSPTECSKTAATTRFFGVELGKLCFCGNTLHSATKTLESECSDICPGDRSQICGGIWRMNLYRHCQLGSYSLNCSKQCHCRVGPCDGVTGACGNGGCKDGWKGIACNEDCQLGSYSLNCSKQCHCRVGPCDGVTGACGNGGCKDGWKGIACNEDCQLGSYSLNCSKQCHCRVGPCDGVTGACGNGGCKDGWKGIACNEAKEDTQQSWIIPLIATAVGLSILIAGVTTIACLCIGRKKRQMALTAVQQNELQSLKSPQGKVEAINAGAKDEANGDNNVINSSDFIE